MTNKSAGEIANRDWEGLRILLKDREEHIRKLEAEAKVLWGALEEVVSVLGPEIPKLEKADIDDYNGLSCEADIALKEAKSAIASCPITKKLCETKETT